MIERILLESLSKAGESAKKPEGPFMPRKPAPDIPIDIDSRVKVPRLPPELDPNVPIDIDPRTEFPRLPPEWGPDVPNDIDPRMKVPRVPPELDPNVPIDIDPRATFPRLPPEWGPDTSGPRLKVPRVPPELIPDARTGVSGEYRKPAGREGSRDNPNKPLESEKRPKGPDPAEGENRQPKDSGRRPPEGQETGKKRMEPPVHIKFKCPEGVDPEEFKRQLAAQEAALNNQTIAENTKNREAYARRKAETGNGRDSAGWKAQNTARQKALQERIEANQQKGMSYAEAKAEAESWIKGQAALHDPDQAAGGEPGKVSGMGDAKANASIGGQWQTRVDELKQAIDAYSEGKTEEELAKTYLNVKLEMEDA